MAQILVCIHCNNPVMEINYKGANPVVYGNLENKFKHIIPLTYKPQCNKNPIMDDDVIFIEEEDL